MLKFGCKYRYFENLGKLYVVIEVFKNLWVLRKLDIIVMVKVLVMIDLNYIVVYDIGEWVGFVVIFI